MVLGVVGVPTCCMVSWVARRDCMSILLQSTLAPSNSESYNRINENFESAACYKDTSSSSISNDDELGDKWIG